MNISPISDFNPQVISDTNGVRIIDPNPLGEIVPHEDMFIFLSLTARQKSKSILTQLDDNKLGVESVIRNSIDLITPQQKTETVNGGVLFGSKPNLTTDWTEINGHNVELQKDFEGFGITNVDIEIKSQISPKVVIDFVDVRGATLFEQGSCSPYGLFFNLPYPIFELTVKGYYGRPVKYYLNLVKFNTKFNSDTGNMECRAEFIGYSFAFLSDTIVGYVAASQYLKPGYGAQQKLREKYIATRSFYQQNGLDVDTAGSGSPWCDNPIVGEGRCYTINDLLKAIKNFDKYTKPQIASSPEFNKLQNLMNLKNSYDTYRDAINSFAGELQESGKGIKVTSSKAYGDKTNRFERFEIPVNLLPELLKDGGVIFNYFNKKSGKLPINIKITKTSQIADGEAADTIVKMLTSASAIDLNGTGNDQCPGCSKMYDKLDKEPWHNILSTQFESTQSLGYTQADTSLGTYFIDMGFIIKDVELELNKLSGEDGELTKLRKEVISNINEIIKSSLGFNPTIRNIFTILLCNTDAFMEILLEVAQNAEKLHQERSSDYKKIIDNENHPSEEKSAILGSGSSDNQGNPKVYAWPTYFKKEFNGGSNGKQQGSKEAFPGEDTRFNDWKEVRFVEDFIDAFLEYQRELDILNDKKEGKAGFDNYVPINPLESPLWNDDNPNKYFGLTNPQEIYTVIGERLFITADHTFFSPIRLTPDAKLIPSIDEGNWNPLKNDDTDNISKIIASIDSWNLLNTQDGTSGVNVLSSLMTGSKDEFIQSVIDGLKNKYGDGSLTGLDGSIKGSDLQKITPTSNSGFLGTDNYYVFNPENGIRLNSETQGNTANAIIIKPNPFDMGVENLFKIIEQIDGENAREIKIEPKDGDFAAAITNYTSNITRKTGDIKFGNNEFDPETKIEIDEKQKTVVFQDPRFFTTLAMTSANSGDLTTWWNNANVQSLSQSNMGLLSYWDYSLNNETFGISLFNPDSQTNIGGAGIIQSGSLNSITGLVDPVEIKKSPLQGIQPADDVDDEGISTPFITTPLWLDNVNSFRQNAGSLKTPATFGQTFYIGENIKNYDSEDIQNKNLAYLFLHTTKPTPLIIRYCNDDGYLFSLEDATEVGITSPSSVYSLKAFNTTSGVVKVPKIWALTLGAELWRWKMFTGTKIVGGKRVWNRPLKCLTCGVGDTPNGFDPLAQPGFNSWDGKVRVDVERNLISTYLTKVYGSIGTTTQTSTFISDYKSAPDLGQDLSDGSYVYFDYYGAFKNKIGEPLLTDLIVSSPSKSDLSSNYRWSQMWIAPHHIPYVHPEHFQDSDDGEGSVYVQLFDNNVGYLDYQTIMPVTLGGLQYSEGGKVSNPDNVLEGNVLRNRNNDGNLGMVIQHLPDEIKDIFIDLFDKWSNKDGEWPNLLKTVDPVNFGSVGSVLTNTYKFDKTISTESLGNGDSGNVALVLKDDTSTDGLKKLLTDQYWILNSTPKIWYGIDSTTDINSNILNQFNNDGFIVSEKVFQDYLGQFYDDFTKNKIQKIKELNKKTTEEETSLGGSTLDDDDVKLSLYRTFKSLTDKWISASDIGGGNTTNGNIRTTKLFFNIVDNGKNCGKNGTGEKPTLAAHFQYVNRVMGDIGDLAVIDLTKLNELKDNIKISLYQYISDVLTENEYMFFPLPGYVNFTPQGLNKEDLEDMFRPILSLDKVSCGPLFLCMYVGGNSRQLKYKGYANCPEDLKNLQNFDDDSFLVSGGMNKPSEISDPASIDKNAGFTAFKVVYGLENQNHFKNIQLDQSEFSETAESLLVIDKLSQQGGTDQTTKGQNLNSVYLTRSYTCQIESLGNMMIQPMTYFDLIGVPMFNGAYLITEVKHNFKPNHATTSFKGTRQPRATVPIITNAAVAMNMSFKDLKSDGSGKSLQQVKQGTQTGTGNGSTSSSPAPGGSGSAQAINVTGAAGSISTDKRPIIDLIIETAVNLGIKDKNRLTALLTVGQAEGGFKILNESFLYSVDRYRSLFNGYPAVKSKTDTELKAILPKSKGCSDCTGSEQAAANLAYNISYNATPTALAPNDGYTYRGRGLTQITFKSNYDVASKNMAPYFPGINLVTNPEKALETDIAVKMLVVLKLVGQFGAKLNPTVNYTDQVYNIISMQDGGRSVEKKNSEALKVYANALATVKKDTYIQDKLRLYPDFAEEGSIPLDTIVRTGRGPKEYTQNIV